MFNSITNNLKKTVVSWALAFKKVPWLLGRHAFLYIMVVIFLELVLGEFLFYQYIILPKNQNIEVANPPTVFRETSYQSVLKEWSKRQAIIESSGKEKYNNPF